MSTESKSARAAMKSKAHRLVGPDPRGAPIDASGYEPPDAEEANVQTGMRPVSKRQFKRGGSIKTHGEPAKNHAGRKARKAGGKAMPPIDAMINRDMKIANEYRDGPHHVGGMKTGGRTKKMSGGPLNTSFMGGELVHHKRGGKAEHTDEAMDRKLIHKMIKPKALTGKAHGGECRCAKCSGGSVSDGKLQGTRPTGDRMARKSGGRAKGKTNINIVIAAHPPGGQQQDGMPGLTPRPPMPPGGPGLPPGMPPGMPPGPPAPMPPPNVGPMMPPPGPMPRKRGGRASYPIDTGSGGGEARLDKIKAYGGG